MKVTGGRVVFVSYNKGLGITVLWRWPDLRRKTGADLSPDGSLGIRAVSISMMGRLDAATGRGEGK
jgi:hypothetical protein